MMSIKTWWVRARRTDGPQPPVVTARQLLPWLLGTAVAFAALVALDQLVLHPGVLTTFRRIQPLSPLYAFLIPRFRLSALLFVLLAGSCAVLLPWLISLRVSARWFAAVLLLLSLALPLALFLVREDLPRLGSQFLIYRGEEYFDDARRVTALGDFLARYTELAPKLSLHGRVHPPGFATFLYAIGRTFSPTPLAAGIAVVVVFAVGTLLAWRAFALVLDERGARIAALVLLAAPSLLDYACTSMDAVFYGIACAVLFAAFLALSEHGRWWHAVLAGLTLYAGMFSSFSAVPLGLFIALYAALTWWERRSWRVPVQLAIALVSFAAAYGIVRYGAAFDLWESFKVARGLHYQIMGKTIGRSVTSAWGPITVGNCAAFLIGTGLAIVPLFARGILTGLTSSKVRPLFLATAVSLAVICAGGVYTMETERILLFAIPWLAVSGVAAAATPLSGPAVVVLVCAGWVQALGMELFFFTLW
jgi:hypothetical protein